jgi:putative aldouronate transport system substrate-binding protein
MRKFWSLALSLVLLAGLLAACGGSGSKNSGGSSGGGGKSSDAGEKPVELIFAVPNPGTAMNDLELVQEEINKITLQKINATVKFMLIDWAAWNQQINLILAGSEQLDLMVTSAFMNYSSMVAKGQLVPLDDLLHQYGQGIMEAMDPVFYEGTRINGKIYGVSSFRELVADYGFNARKDLLDKHNIDLSQIKSFEELEPIFQLIKEKEPGIIPLVQRNTSNTVVSDMIATHVDSQGDGMGVLMLDDNNTTVVNLYETPQYRQAVELARKWYNAGYIAPDAATSQEGYVALMKAGKGFGYFSNMKPGFEVQETRLTGYEIEGVRLTPAVGGSSGPVAFMISIPSNTKHPEKAMQFMNLLYTDADIMNLITLGIEGKHYVKMDNGQVRLPDGVETSGYVFNQWLIGNNSLTYLWEGWDPNQWENLKEFNRNAVYSPALGFLFDANSVKTEVAAVSNVISEYKAGLESGSVDPKVLDQFIDDLKKAGIDTIIAEKQRQLDEFLAANQ